MADTTNTTNAAEMTEEEVRAQATGTIDFAEKKAAKEESMNYTHKFSSPVEMEGKKYTTLTFYFDKLTGDDIDLLGNTENLGKKERGSVDTPVVNGFMFIGVTIHC